MRHRRKQPHRGITLPLGVTLIAMSAATGCLAEEAADHAPSPDVEASDAADAEGASAAPTALQARVEQWQDKRARARETAHLLLGAGTIVGEVEGAEQVAEELAAVGLDAAAIVVARPVAERVEVESLGGEPHPRTYVTLRVDRVLVGEAPTEIEVSFWGGEHEGRHFRSSTTVSLERDASKVFFLALNRNGDYQLRANRSGYALQDDALESGPLRLSFSDLASVLETARRVAQ